VWCVVWFAIRLPTPRPFGISILSVLALGRCVNLMLAEVPSACISGWFGRS
jgi:hypothetical protein